jgi:VIT1/CCC1 family predicted Fe2+/Mn2+ transporter
MFNKRIDKIKEAYKSKNRKKSREIHQSHEHYAEEHSAAGSRIKSLVYGGLDGIITTFAVVAGVEGASMSSTVVLVLGFSNLVADGLSMAVGDFLSTKAENEYNHNERQREMWELENYPEGEKKEMVEIYKRKGLSAEDADLVVTTLMKNKEVFLDTMMKEELGIVEESESPIWNALTTFFSFLTFGFIPLLIFVVSFFTDFFQQHIFLIACVLTGITLFLLGSYKVRFTLQKWYVSGLEMLMIGGIASLAAYFIGKFLGGILG